MSLRQLYSYYHTAKRPVSTSQSLFQCFAMPIIHYLADSIASLQQYYCDFVILISSLRIGPWKSDAMRLLAPFWNQTHLSSQAIVRLMQHEPGAIVDIPVVCKYRSEFAGLLAAAKEQMAIIGLARNRVTYVRAPGNLLHVKTFA